MTKKKLTDTRVRNTKPREKSYKVFDESGLYLLVNPSGSKFWRFKYRFQGREKLLSFGGYPEVSLEEARDQRNQARNLLKGKRTQPDGSVVTLPHPIDPSAERKAAQLVADAEEVAYSETFEYVALEFLLLQAGKSPTAKPAMLPRLKRSLDNRLTELAEQGRAGAAKAKTLRIMRQRIESLVVPHIGQRSIGRITGPELLAVARRIESRRNKRRENRPTLETARRTLAACSRVFKYAVATGRAQYDPAASVDRSALVPLPKRTGFAAIVEPKKIGELLRAIDGYQGQPTVVAALKLAPLVFVRPGELRAAEWSEFDLEAAEWRIPADRMKMDAPHVVPLASHAIAILEELQLHTGNRRLLFPSLRSRERCISDNTLNAALRRLGFSKAEMTAHGFRKMASTRLNELGFNRDAIERQLAHADRDPVRAAYNYAEYLPQRREMMQAWADYLDGLRTGKGNVIALRQQA